MKDLTTATTSLVLEIPCNVSGECNSTWRPPWMGCSYAAMICFVFMKFTEDAKQIRDVKNSTRFQNNRPRC